MRKNPPENPGFRADEMWDTAPTRGQFGSIVGSACHRLLRAWGDGDGGALEQLTLLVEAELPGWRECTYAASGAGVRCRPPGDG
jgi:hypothetical protein